MRRVDNCKLLQFVLILPKYVRINFLSDKLGIVNSLGNSDLSVSVKDCNELLSKSTFFRQKKEEKNKKTTSHDLQRSKEIIYNK